MSFENCIYLKICKIKRATKSYFTHYSCVVIVLINTALCRSAFPTISFRKLVYRPSVLRFLWIKTLKFALSCNVQFWYVILFSLYIKTHLLSINKQAIYESFTVLCKNTLSEMFWVFHFFFFKRLIIKKSVEQSIK